jgi:hypothetical protein
VPGFFLVRADVGMSPIARRAWARALHLLTKVTRPAP